MILRHYHYFIAESYAETDSNTEIKKREKSNSPTEFNKSTLMDQWRQDLNYHCPTDFDDVYGKMNGNVSFVFFCLRKHVFFYLY